MNYLSVVVEKMWRRDWKDSEDKKRGHTSEREEMVDQTRWIGLDVRSTRYADLVERSRSEY
jgi:hypothetical protein